MAPVRSNFETWEPVEKKFEVIAGKAWRRSLKAVTQKERALSGIGKVCQT